MEGVLVEEQTRHTAWEVMGKLGGFTAGAEGGDSGDSEEESSEVVVFLLGWGKEGIGEAPVAVVFGRFSRRHWRTAIKVAVVEGLAGGSGMMLITLKLGPTGGGVGGDSQPPREEGVDIAGGRDKLAGNWIYFLAQLILTGA